MTLGHKIRELLARRGWSASRLAGKVDVSPAAISRIIAGGDTSTSIGFRLSRKLDVPPAWLFDDSVGMESLSEYEETSGLAGVSDRDLVLALDARLIRIEAMYADALGQLKQIPLSEKHYLHRKQDQVLRGVIAQAGYDGYVFLVLLHTLLKLQERIAQLDKELRRRPSPPPPPRPGSLSAALPQLPESLSAALRSISPFPDPGLIQRLITLAQSLSPPDPAATDEPQPRPTGKKSAPAKPQRPKRPPRS